MHVVDGDGRGRDEARREEEKEVKEDCKERHDMMREKVSG